MFGDNTEEEIYIREVETENPKLIKTKQLKRNIMADEQLLDNEDEIARTKIYKAGNAKIHKLCETADRKYILSEYRDEVSPEYLAAVVEQQKILHRLYPSRFVVDIYRGRVGSDGKARYVATFIDNIDPVKSLNISGPGWQGEQSANYIAAVLSSEEFKAQLPDMERIGLIPHDENSSGGPYTNELAGNTMYDSTGHQIMVDVLDPYIKYIASDGEWKVRPSLDIGEIAQVAKEKGVEDEIADSLKAYKKYSEEVVSQYLVDIGGNK